MKWYPCMETCFYLLFLVAWLLPLSSKHTATGINIQCVDKEREALLNFKQGIQPDSCGLLTTWVGPECCNWYGIHCSNSSGHVISLDLRLMINEQGGCSLRGNVSSSLVELKHLNYLDLSGNSFQGQNIPSFIGSFYDLKYLNLAYAGFRGEVPHQLGNLSSLAALDLSSYENFLFAKSLGWLSHLTLLRDVKLSGVDLSLATDWAQVVNSLPLLSSLRMDRCSLYSSVPSSLAYTNSSTTLQVLDLGYNQLHGSSILQWVSNLSRISTGLEYLDVSNNWLQGSIPTAFGNYMHSLVRLHLHKNSLQGPIPVAFGNMRSLSVLRLQVNRFQGSISPVLGNMHSLSYLDLSFNVLEGLVPGSIFELNLLEHLDLSTNNFEGIQSSHSQGSLCSLQTLRLTNNYISSDFSSITEPFSGCANNSLVVLDISNNRFWGSIPDAIGAFSSLEELVLNSNQLNGTINPSLGQLSRLELLDFSSNSLRGTLSDHHLSNLSTLRQLYLSDNPELVINISAKWVPPFQLDTIILRSCKSPYFPKWLVTPVNLSYVDISNSGISDTIPTSFWDSFLSKLNYLNLSNNEIHGLLPTIPPAIGFAVSADYNDPNYGRVRKIDLSSNRIEGAIPSFLGNATVLLLNNNRFSGSIASFCPKAKAYIQILDISDNLLSGELPDCWQAFDFLWAFRLDNNNFVGKLPPSLGALNYLGYLSMRNNGFNGELQMPVLENWINLHYLDLAHNSFSGHIPAGIGSTLNSIEILDLRSNKFFGKLPLSLCQLSSLRVLDLSYNQISGTIPECICHLQAMTNSVYYDGYGLSVHHADGRHGDYGNDSLPEMIMWKKKEQSFVRTWGVVTYMAIADNQLQGHIPSGISCLRGLLSLDYARNNLTGSIPPEIGNLTSLVFLDLSRNHLSGQIPSSLANLNFLGTLDLSYNNLSGQIPTGVQVLHMDPAAYMGNPGLCGSPLPECTRDPAYKTMSKGDKDDGIDFFLGLYVSVVLGFIVGFWGFCGTLVIKRSCRHSYFRFVEDTYDRLHFMVVVTIHKVWRRS